MSLCETCGSQVDSSGCQVCLLQLGISNYPHNSADPNQASLATLDQLNELFPQFEINRLIGRGGMGAIYHARQTNLERDVAIKIIASEVAGDTAFIERFEREAKTLARLSHPNIVTVYDYGQTTDGQAYLVMEYVDGINLREAIDAQSVAPNDALHVVQNICDALKYAHSKGVVHRDVKPENILLGEDGTIKVADFGIAKIVDESVRTPTLTATRQVLGSLHYLAPEHLEAPAEVDHRVDLYALGVVFYELLTGQLPLGRFDPPSAVQNQLDARLDPIVMKSLSRKPIHRYQTAAELKAELNGVELHGVQPSQSAVSANQDQPPEIEPVRKNGRRSVPFTCEALGGMAEAVGMLHSRGDSLCFEYRVRDAFWGTVKSQTHTVHIPVDELAKVELTPGVFSAKLSVYADTISTLDKLPNAETGCVTVKIKRSDLEMASELVKMLGFGGKPHVVKDQKQDDAKLSRWITFGFLTMFSGILNAGLLAAIEVSIAHEFRGTEAIAASLCAAIFIGPIAIFQFVAGLLCLVFRPVSLGKTVSIVSMLPIAPGWALSGPTGLWAYLWLRAAREEPNVRSAIQHQPRSSNLRNWGNTTLMYIRESRWGKFVAVANFAALILVAAGVFVYQFGYYPVTLTYRVVDSGASSGEMLHAARTRLGDLVSIDNRRSDNQRLVLSTMERWREKVESLLEIESPVELIWVLNPDSANTEESKLGQEYPVAAGVQVSNSIESASMGIAVVGRETAISVSGNLASQVRPSSYGPGAISIGLTQQGRRLVFEDRPKNSPGLALLIDGVVEGFADQEHISAKSLSFVLAKNSDLDFDAVAAAIRGPEIPSDLELLP